MNLKSFLISWLLLSSLSISAQSLSLLDNKNFFQGVDPYKASLMYAFIGGPYQNQIVEKIPIITSRKNLPLVGHRSDFSFSFFPTEKNAPLVIVIGGLGSHHMEDSMLYAANLFNKKGYNVLGFSSTMNWTFALTASQSGVPGHTGIDSKELYFAIEKSIRHIEQKYQYKFSSVGISGFSLGALNAAYVAKYDLEYKLLKINNVLLINVPVNIEYGLAVLDSLYAEGNAFNQTTKDKIHSYVLGYYFDVQEKLNRKIIKTEDVVSQFNLELSKVRYLIGDRFRDSLRDTLFVSQIIAPSGIMKTAMKKNLRNARMIESKNFSFLEYKKMFLYPNWKLNHPEGKKADFDKNIDLYDATLSLKQYANLTIIHSEDDFLLRPEDLIYLKSEFKENLHLYKNGGHGGNFILKNTVIDIIQSMEL